MVHIVWNYKVAYVDYNSVIEDMQVKEMRISINKDGAEKNTRFLDIGISEFRRE